MLEVKEGVERLVVKRDSKREVPSERVCGVKVKVRARWHDWR
jgi:hypothetical protein